MNIGILALARPTFDIPFAQQKLKECLKVFSQTNYSVYGQCELLLDSDQTLKEIDILKSKNLDAILILQVTFTDAAMSVIIAKNFDLPLSIWAIPEPRLGGRLRLNAFCGLNLASHALGLNEKQFLWLYQDPNELNKKILDDLFHQKKFSPRSNPRLDNSKTLPKAEEIVKKVSNFKIARIGEHPEGFDTCRYDDRELEDLSGVRVDTLTLHDLFDEAKNISDEVVNDSLLLIDTQLAGLDKVNPKELRNSVRLKSALENIKNNGSYNAFALRCWPEMFTEYGGAICGPASILGEKKIPCACEADVYGSLTQLILQEVSQSQVFLTDIVDISTKDDTGVLWHCGQAPISMCDENYKATATIHTNRRMPLLFEFPLKSGSVTLMRISKSFGENKMIISNGQMLKRDMAFTGTSGVIKFENTSSEVLNNIISSGMEHHMALAYGDHREILKEVAKCMQIPVLEI